jgi:glycosyltransferase involved in cell wall biosynthesis
VRVAVDGRALRPGVAHRRGVARYVRCMLEALGEAEPADDYLVVVAGAGDPEPFRAPNVGLVRSRVPGRLLFGAASLAGRPRLDRLAGGCDVAWVPAPTPLALSRGVPLVLSLLDLSFEHRTDFGYYERLWHRLARPERLTREATRVICLSGPVRDAAVARWGLSPERMRVVPPGAGKPPVTPDELGGDGAAGELPAGVNRPYLLAVGALEPRKLPGVLVEAHRIAGSRGLEAGLVIAGDGPLRSELERSQATVLGHVPDPVLEVLYAGALALACVSRDEGFGFTPVEALARGAPAVVADLPVFAETLGAAALRVPAGDAEALAEALLRLEREPGLRERLVAAGREVVARFSWERAARETRAVLAEAAS